MSRKNVEKEQTMCPDCYQKDGKHAFWCDNWHDVSEVVDIDEELAAGPDASYFLSAAQKMHSKKNNEYGSGHIRHGNAMAALFPNGLNLKTPSDFARFALFDLLLVKMVRYSANFAVPHRDSIKDIIVYAAMLEEANAKATNNRG